MKNILGEGKSEKAFFPKIKIGFLKICEVVFEDKRSSVSALVPHVKTLTPTIVMEASDVEAGRRVGRDGSIHYWVGDLPVLSPWRRGRTG